MSAERAIRIEAGSVRLYAILAATPTAAAIWEALPLEGPARRQPHAVLLDVSLRCPLELPPKGGMKAGDLALRTDAPAIALHFGPAATDAPADRAPDAPANIFGRITGDVSRLERVEEGMRVRLTPLEG
jgi:hypothetical protein